MIVVSDTTPIISLLKINRLDILEKLFTVVEIPQGVYTELVSNPSFSDESAIISDSSFLHKVTIQDYKSVELLRRKSSKQIVLIDGDKLTDLMIQYNLGVSTDKVIEIKRIDSDYFEQ